MDYFAQLLALMFGAIVIDNFVLTRFLGLCSFFGVSKRIEPSVGLGLAMIFVMGASSLICSLLYRYLLIPLQIEYLRIIIFVIVIAAFVQLAEMFIRNRIQHLYKTFGAYLSLVSINCAVLYATLYNAQQGYDVLKSTLHGIAGGIGFFLALILLSYTRQRLEMSGVPEPLRGLPISFIVMGLMAMAFFGFYGFAR